MPSKTKELIKLLERLIKQDHLYDSDKIVEMKKELYSLKQQIAEYEKQNSKGFSK
tara:strand:- start:692 stop:856 length:165 start_codon:yes stop_codon:yes gene_type:complete